MLCMMLGSLIYIIYLCHWFLSTIYTCRTLMMVVITLRGLRRREMGHWVRVSQRKRERRRRRQRKMGRGVEMTAWVCGPSFIRYATSKQYLENCFNLSIPMAFSDGACIHNAVSCSSIFSLFHPACVCIYIYNIIFSIYIYMHPGGPTRRSGASWRHSQRREEEASSSQRAACHAHQHAGTTETGGCIQTTS